MLSKIPQHIVEHLTIRDLEELLERKKKNECVAELVERRDALREELRQVEERIDEIERSGRDESSEREDGESSDLGSKFGVTTDSPRARLSSADVSPVNRRGASASQSFLRGRKRRNLKDYIAQVLLEADEALAPTEIQQRLPDAGYVSSSTNPRSFYNTVFQALQRYEIFEKAGRKYRLADEALKRDGVREILPRKKTRLKDYITEVLDSADVSLKSTEIASRVVIAGYETDLVMEELHQRVSATLKKYVSRDFDWDGQRYRLARREGP